MLSAVELIVTEFVVVAVICFLLLRYYAAAMVSTDIRFTVYLSWILGFIGILILPYDLSNAVVYDNHVNVLSGVWRFVYWSTFFLAWIVLPIQMEMHGSGKFSLKEKLWDAVYKLVVQGVLAVVASCCYVIYLVSSGHGTVSQVLGFTMAMGNTYGVLLLSLLMGNGLVAIPLSLWRLGDVEKGLQEIYLSAATIEEAFQDDKYELDDCENEVTRISDVLDKAGPNSILHNDIGAFVQLLKGKLTADRAPQRTTFHSYRVESISEFELVKKAYLTDLHKRLIIAQLKFKASQRRWIVLIDHYKKQQRIVLLNEDSADKSYHTYWERLIIHLTQKFYVHACRLLALLCGFVSALILWCELLMSSSWGSPIGMMMTVGGGEQSSSVTVQGISFIVLAYMSICTYWPLFRLNIGWKYKLEGPQQSSPFSLIFNGQYLSRLQFTIGYNFLLLLNVHSTNRTAFHELMKNSELIPVFGASFNIYIPLVMLLIALITLFDGYSRIIKLLGVEMEDNVTSYKGFTLDSLLWCLRRGGNQSTVESDPELEEKLRLGKIIIMKELKRLNEPVVEDLDFSDGLSAKTNTGSSSACGSLKGSSKGLKEVLMKKYAPVQPDDDRFNDYPDERIDSSFDEDSFSCREDLANKSSFFKPVVVSGRGGDSSTFSPMFKSSSGRMTPDLFSISHDGGEKAPSYGGRYADLRLHADLLTATAPLSAMELPETLDYLHFLSSCADDAVPCNNSYLLETLIASLRSDGYQLLSTQTSNGIYNIGAENLISISPNDVYQTMASTRLLNNNSDKGSPDLTSVIMVVVCVLFAALASGLTQGLLSLDLMEMEIKVRSGTDLEKKYASKVIPLISRHHLLLVSLMLWNASATEALPIFLSKLVPEFLAVIISVTLVLFAGEIIPASILTGPNQLQIASGLTPLVYLVLCVFFPIAYPISLCLDCIIGHEAGITMYNRKEIATLMTIQREQGLKQREIERSRKHNSSTASRTLRWSLRNFSQAADTSPHMYHQLEKDLESSRHSSISVMEEDEVDIINGALKYRDMLVSAVMTPLSAVYMISAHELLSYKTLYEIFKSGYSRIPVYNRDPDDIIGLLLAKDLLFIDPEDLTPVQNFIGLFGRKPGNVLSDCKLGETLRKFRDDKSHMAIVRQAPNWVDIKGGAQEMHTDRVVGIITLEDIIEEILGTEIEDETDSFKVRPVDAEGTPVEPMRDVGLARLRTMHSSQILDADQLTEEEVQSVEIFLITNVPQIQHLFKNSGSGSLQSFIRSSAVISMTRKSNIACSPSHEDFLYRKGKMTNTCTLVLRGSIAIESSLPASLSNDVVLKSEWSIIAIEALTKPEGTFVPDFSAYISSEHIRFLSMAKYTTPKLFKDSAGVTDEGLNEFIKFRKKIHRSPGGAGKLRRSITTAGLTVPSAEQKVSPVTNTTTYRPPPIDLLQFSKVRSTTGHLTSSILRRGRSSKERGTGSEDSMVAPLLPETDPGEEVAIFNLVRSDTR